MAADYVIITTTPFTFSVTVGGEQDKSFEFTLPSGVKVDSNSILSWTLDWSQPSGQMSTTRININTKEVYNRTIYGGSYFVSLNAIIAPNVLKEAGKTNNIEFEVQATSGTNITFSQVHLMVQI